MIIKIKKRDLLVIIVSLIFISSIPLIYSADVKDAQSSSFGVWLTIANQNPLVVLNNVSSFNVDPQSGSDAVIVIGFNASDPDDVNQINGTDGGRIIVNLTLGTPGFSQFRTQTSCTNTTSGSGSSGKITGTCVINLRYYDNASAFWKIAVTIIDSNSGSATNDSGGTNNNNEFTYNTLAAFTLRAKSTTEASQAINFSTLNVNDVDKPAKTPIQLNNTGNDDFDQINITGADLLSNGNSIVIGSFFVNVTNNTVGAGLPLTAGPQVIPSVADIGGSGGSKPNATLLHGPGISGDTVPYAGPTDTKGNQSLYFFVDVPAGTSTGTYNNTWNITVVDID